MIAVNRTKNRQLYFTRLLKIIIISIICLNLLIPFLLKAAEQNIEEPQSGSLRIINQQQQLFTALSLKTDIDMAITGLTARVKVTQVFKNDRDQWVEGKYLFPLPDNAAVDHLTIKIGERLIVGEIKEKQQAKKIYQQAKIAGKKASLVEQHRPNLFTNSVANIGPYETIEITIEYQQDVFYDREEGFSIRFPMAITPRYQPKKIYRESFAVNQSFNKNLAGFNQRLSNNGFINQVSQIRMLFPNSDESQNLHADNVASINIQLDAGFALQDLSSTSHKIHHQQKTESAYKINFVNQNVKADHDFILNWKPVASMQPRAALFSEQKAGQNYLSLMVMPPSAEYQTDDEINREIIFVIDTSGSMGGDSIRQARKALEFGLSTLSAQDHFNVIQFNSSTSQLFQSTRLANQSNIRMAQSYVRRLEANGGTEMFSAIQASLDGRSDHSTLRQVIFLTDGAISNEAQLFKLIEGRLGDSRLYTVGIGSAPNEFFMKKAARFGRGSFTFIKDIRQSSTKMEKLFDSISRPQLTHISIDWPDNIHSETWPDKIPDLYDGEPLWLKSKVSDLSGQVRIAGRLKDTLWQSDLSLENPQQQLGVAVLWAREKIAAIMNSAYHGAVNDQQKNQIISTALEHHLVSRFTSLVAVDKTPSRTAEKLHQQKIAGHLPKGSDAKRVKSPSVPFARTSLDLDITARGSLMLFLLSLFSLYFYRRMG